VNHDKRSEKRVHREDGRGQKAARRGEPDKGRAEKLYSADLIP
jgi:hypothetical protein